MNSRSCSLSSSDLWLRAKSTTDTSFGLHAGPCRLRHRRPRRSPVGPRALWGTPTCPPCAVRAPGRRSYRVVMSTGTVSGIAQQRVDRCLAAHVGGVEPPFRYRLIAGGRSNLTYDVLD